MASRWKLSTSAWVKKTAEVKTAVRKNPLDITCALAILLALAILDSDKETLSSSVDKV